MKQDKRIPVCHACGNYTCSDCGAGFPSRDQYVRHRIDPQAHPEPAKA